VVAVVRRNPVNIIADINAVGNGTIVAAFHNKVLIEKPDRALRRSSSHSNNESVEVKKSKDSNIITDVDKRYWEQLP